jgi:hypothetical protein
VNPRTSAPSSFPFPIISSSLISWKPDDVNECVAKATDILQISIGTVVSSKNCCQRILSGGLEPLSLYDLDSDLG